MMSKKALPKRPLAHTLSQPIDAVEYVVSASDTLPGIAARFDTVPSELAKLNKLTSRLIFPGQVLLVPKKTNDVNVKDDVQISSAATSLSEGENKEFSQTLVVTETDRQSNTSASPLDVPRFLKIKSRYITDGQGVVAGILIVTPNAVMFDPNVSDPVVIEHGIENYGVIAPINMVMKAAIYYDIAHMAVSHLNEVPRNIPKPEMYEKKSAKFSDKTYSSIKNVSTSIKSSETQQSFGFDKESSLQDSSDTEETNSTFRDIKTDRADSLIRTRKFKSSEDIQETNEKIKDEIASVGINLPIYKHEDDHTYNKFSRANRANSCYEPIHGTKELIEQKQSNEYYSKSFVSGQEMKYSIEQSIVQDKIQNSAPKANLLISSDKRTNEIQDFTLPSISSFDCKSADDKANLFITLDQIIAQPRPAISHDPPLYLCLRMGRPLNKEVKRSTPFLVYKKRVKREYWFSVSQDRVDDVYDFLHYWVPHLYGDIIDIEPQALGFVPINEEEEEPEMESVDEEELNQESINNSFEGAMKLLRSSPLSILKVVEDHFGGGNITKEDWELLSMDNSEKSPSAKSVELPLPESSDQSEILTDEQKRQLCNRLPARALGYPWTLIYSTCKHGFSLKTMYRNMSTLETPVLLTISDTNGAVFGALSSCSLKVSDHFYGTGESFLYSFINGFKCYPWSGDNMFFIKGNNQSLAIGAGDGHFGLWLDGDLYHGSSRKCRTFNNDCLASQEDFVIKGLEAWGFV